MFPKSYFCVSFFPSGYYERPASAAIPIASPGAAAWWDAWRHKELEVIREQEEAFLLGYFFLRGL
jgi:hypothetical protein